jgi:sorting nexin-41/42
MMDSIALDDGFDNADDDWGSVDPRFDVPNTPSSTSEDVPQQQPSYARHDLDSDDEAEAAARDRGELIPRIKPGGYDSRIEQILYENPELPVIITDAGKSVESGGRYIVYTIRTGVRHLSRADQTLATNYQHRI